MHESEIQKEIREASKVITTIKFETAVSVSLDGFLRRNQLGTWILPFVIACMHHKTSSNVDDTKYHIHNQGRDDEPRLHRLCIYDKGFNSCSLRNWRIDTLTAQDPIRSAWIWSPALEGWMLKARPLRFSS
jgi:hypothetical protein